MNSWAFYSSGMPSVLGWFYKAAKPRLKVWMSINHGEDDDSCSCFTQLSSGYHTSAHHALFSTFASVCREGGLLPSGLWDHWAHQFWYWDSRGCPYPAHWCSASTGCSSAATSGTPLRFAFPPGCHLNSTVGARRTISQISLISVVRATDL